MYTRAHSLAIFQDKVNETTLSSQAVICLNIIFVIMTFLYIFIYKICLACVYNTHFGGRCAYVFGDNSHHSITLMRNVCFFIPYFSCEVFLFASILVVVIVILFYQMNWQTTRNGIEINRSGSERASEMNSSIHLHVYNII